MDAVAVTVVFAAIPVVSASAGMIGWPDRESVGTVVDDGLMTVVAGIGGALIGIAKVGDPNVIEPAGTASLGTIDDAIGALITRSGAIDAAGGRFGIVTVPRTVVLPRTVVPGWPKSGWLAVVSGIANIATATTAREGRRIGMRISSKSRKVVRTGRSSHHRR